MSTFLFALISSNYMSKQAAIKLPLLPYTSTRAHYSHSFQKQCFALQFEEYFSEQFNPASVLFACLCVSQRRCDTLIGEIPLPPLLLLISVAQFEI